MGELLAIAGIGLAHTTKIFNGVKKRLEGSDAVVFLPNPFENWSHPLVWSEQQRDRGADSRLFLCCAELQWCFRLARDHLQNGKTVVMQHGGIDALNWATGILASEAPDDTTYQQILREINDARDIHHNWFVPMRVGPVVPKPKYMLIWADPSKVTAESVKHSRSLQSIPIDRLRAFLTYEAEQHADYERHGQKIIFRIDATARRLDDMVDLCASEIHRRSQIRPAMIA